MTPKQIALKIMTKDTCYGMYDAKTPTDKELAEYFATWILDFAKDYHKEMIIKDEETKKEEAIKEAQWWNNED